MTQTEKIRAYLLGQLSPEETEAFKQEIRANPTLTAEVKRIKVQIIEEEMEMRAALRENMAKWEGALPSPNPKPAARRFRPISVLIGLALLLLVGVLWIWKTTPTVLVPSTAQDTTTENAEPAVVPPDQTSATAPPTTGRPPNLAEAEQLQRTFQRWSNAFLSISVNRYDQAVALRGAGRTGTTQAWKPQRRDQPYYGFILQKGNNHYVVAPAAAVALASNTWGDVMGKDAQGQSYGLRLLGKDDFWGIALLELPTSAVWEKRALHLGGRTKLKGPIFQFNGPLTSNNPEKNWMPALIQQQKNVYLLSAGKTALANMDGPLLDTTGQVLGIASPLARAAFGLQTSEGRYVGALSANAASALIDQLLANKTVRRPYLGIVFEQIEAGVRVANILSGSPASPYTDKLLGGQVDSVNGTKIQNLLDINEILAPIRPRETVQMVVRDAKGQRWVQRLYAKPMDEAALQTIGEAVVNNMDGFNMLHEAGGPAVEYKGALLEEGIYYILAACPGRNACADNILSLTDLGIQMRSVALQKEGVLRVLNTNAPEKMLYYPVTFQNARLWH